MVGGQGDHGPVVEQDAGLAQHESVARAARLQGLEIVDVETIKKLQGIGALDLDLAERGAIEESGGRADSVGFAARGLLAAFPGSYVGHCPLPAAEVLEDTAV